MRLKGRRAVVTGAAGGIGRALSEGVAREGAAVVCIDRDGAGANAVAAELATRGFTAHALECDLSDISAVEQVLRRSVELLGGVDAVFANAGGVRDSHNNKLLPPLDWCCPISPAPFSVASCWGLRWSRALPAMRSTLPMPSLIGRWSNIIFSNSCARGLRASFSTPVITR